jgi:hypothetical protein
MRFPPLLLLICSYAVAFIATPDAKADGKVVLLSSFGSKGKELRLENKLEKIFHRNLGTEFVTKTIHNADQEILFRELNDPSNQAVFWVSHAGFQKSRRQKKAEIKSGIAPSPMILDYRGDDVSPVFKKNHPNLRLLAVMSCNVDQILFNLETANFLSHGKVSGPNTLKKAISKFKKLDTHSRDHQDHKLITEPTAQARLTIQRALPNDAPLNSIRSLRIMQDGKLLGIIPASLPGETIETDIRMDPQMILKPTEIQTGQTMGTDGQNIIFGDISVSVQDHNYRLFTDRDGVPFGKTMRVFLP